MNANFVSRRSFFETIGKGGAALAIGSALVPFREVLAADKDKAEHTAKKAVATTTHGASRRHVVADPTHIPPPIDRNHALHHDLTLDIHETVAELANGIQYHFMTFGGQVPGPMLRVREGDTVTFTLNNPTGNSFTHNIDMHAVYGPGGGAAKTKVRPGEAKTEIFKAMYPGAYIYHCAVMPNLDFHISSGMYGMILVEPKEGLSRVDREFYIGQNEIYSKTTLNDQGMANPDFDLLVAENPSFVIFNGGAFALTNKYYGTMKAKVGETVRIFMVNGGPNLTSSFHPIGNVWTRCWSQGALANPPRRYVQTETVPPGSAFVGEMELTVPETIKLVDHAISRVTRKGALAEIQVEGAAQPGIYQPS